LAVTASHSLWHLKQGSENNLPRNDEVVHSTTWGECCSHNMHIPQHDRCLVKYFLYQKPLDLSL